jgi:hypothetical protein
MERTINLDEGIGKTVGRRREQSDSFAHAMALQKIASEILKTTGRGLCPRGVYKFKTHEEADAWMLKMQARPAKTKI